MRRNPLPILACLLFSACLEMEHTVVLGPDGSGRHTVKLAMNESTLADLQRASAAAKSGGAANLAAVFDKELVARELQASGLELVRHTSKRDAGRRSVDLEAAFKDFASLQKSPLAGSAAEWVLAAGPRAGTAKLTLYPQGKAAWTEARAKADKMQGEVDAVTADFFRKKQQALGGLDLTLRMQLPGDVLVWTANMEQAGPREVVAHITADQIKTPQDLVRRLAPRFEVIFDSTGCKLPLP